MNIELSNKQLTHLDKLPDSDKTALLKILEGQKKSNFKNAKKQLKATKKDYSGIPIKDVTYKLINADFRTITLEEKADWIITDPPYPQQYLELYSGLSKFAQENLKDGGSLICMVGQSYLPEVIKRLSENLSYHWTLAYLTPGGQASQIWPKHVNTFWKPLLWFCKGKYKKDWIGDVCKSPTNHNDKHFHRWGQSVEGMNDIIEKFTYPKELIVDPCLGGGTTGISCLSLRRNFIGIDIDCKCIETSEKRFQELIENG